jgi:hypothetical protein
MGVVTVDVHHFPDIAVPHRHHSQVRDNPVNMEVSE